MAVRALQRLGYILGEAHYADAARDVLQLYAGVMGGRPAGLATLLTALQEYVTPLRLLVLRGEQAQLMSWHKALREIHAADVVCLALPAGLAKLPRALDKPVDDAPVAWLCQGTQCLPAIHDAHKLCEMLRARQDV